MDSIGNDCVDVIYKYKHNLLMSDVMHELNLCMRREWQGGVVGSIYLVKYEYKKRWFCDQFSTYNWRCKNDVHLPVII